MVKKELQKLLEKPMNRKQFLAHLGAGALTVIGISGLLKHLVNLGAKPSRQVADGYGASAYGGRKR